MPRCPESSQTTCNRATLSSSPGKRETRSRSTFTGFGCLSINQDRRLTDPFFVCDSIRVEVDFAVLIYQRGRCNQVDFSIVIGVGELAVERSGKISICLSWPDK